MREILFRGKRLDNGEWVEGSYLKCRDYLAEEALHIIAIDATKYPHNEICGCVEVNPDTVGQFTGLTANGKKIFEGDILAIKFHPEYVNRICWQGPPDAIAEVYWDFSGFRLKATNGIDRRYPALVEANFKETEVIGNIHDNPELLKAGAMDEKL